ncbi:N-succinylarginine dihydrolase [Fontivita pretiosa]|uniref:N-succinylarginine dihydrolase n=1 Tax=Fontivita pretiosa TaxID=2989684 RepID=UPI003D1778AE
MAAYEVNFDGLVGPTHNYAGLSYGNVASMRHRASTSNPRQAALQGLAKMKFLAEMGLKQAVLPPHQRPHLPTLRRLGFTGTDTQVLEQAHRQAPQLLAAACSASSMWAANAATVSASPDCADGRVHFTVANLIANLHRSIESQTTTRILRTIFADPSRFAVHDPLPAALHLGDEGAANHTRLCANHASAGVEIFTFGRVALDPSRPAPARFPARQTLEASSSIARLHQLDPGRTIYLQQHPAAIDSGAFHNDVVAVGNENVLLYHELAYLDPPKLDESFHLIQVPQQEVSLEQAVATYLFNSQLVTLPNGAMSLIAPMECRHDERVHAFIQEHLLQGDTPIRSVHFVDVRQSMRNGGGPACLRLRVVLTEDQLSAMRGAVLLTDALYDRLVSWVHKHYRDRLEPDDLRDHRLLEESLSALDELSGILRLGSIFEFQQSP